MYEKGVFASMKKEVYTSDVYTSFQNFELDNLFSREVILELGSGNGVFLVHLGRTFKDKNVIGIELDIKRAKKCYKRISKEGLENTFVFSGDAKEIIPLFFPSSVVSKTFILFPDPWPKSSTWRNRLFEISSSIMVDRISKVGATFNFVTDVEYIFSEVNELFTKVLGNWDFSDEGLFEFRKLFVPTLYYEKWLGEGRNFYWGVWIKKF
jgi:tRNA (guanine-N7-)-methyltransferase